MSNAEKDGLVENKKVEGLGFHLTSPDGYSRTFPLSFTYWVTDEGIRFVDRLVHAKDIDGPSV
ncbi:MAG: hypothetical protein ACOYEV_07350 [Candidatus Nanopelagicales bacterium]